MSDDWLNDIKIQFKKNPSIYKLIVDIISTVKFNNKKNFQVIYKYLISSDRLIVVNIGSGPFSLDSDMINVDMTVNISISSCQSGEC
jgi:hypothetical protein